MDTLDVHCDADGGAVALNDIKYLDFPELKFNEHESTEMPFRYVEGTDGNPIMPEVRVYPVESGPSLSNLLHG